MLSLWAKSHEGDDQSKSHALPRQTSNKGKQTCNRARQERADPRTRRWGSRAASFSRHHPSKQNIQISALFKHFHFSIAYCLHSIFNTTTNVHLQHNTIHIPHQKKSQATPLFRGQGVNLAKSQSVTRCSFPSFNSNWVFGGCLFSYAPNNRNLPHTATDHHNLEANTPNRSHASHARAHTHTHTHSHTHTHTHTQRD
jgi:hypothetical protein